MYIRAAMEEKEKKIIEGAMKTFMQFGIKSVNMDDMARHLGVSKKTLYVYVSDKEELVEKAINLHCEIEDAQIEEICSRGLGAIDESLEIFQTIIEMLINLHPSVAYDLEKYHPAISKRLMLNRNDVVYGCMLKNIIKGQKEGVYRRDFDAEIITRMYLSHVNAMIDPKLFTPGQWKLSQVYKEGFIYHIRGIASQKGLDELKEKIKHIK